MVTIQMENEAKLFDEMEMIDDCQDMDFSLLNESNIAGASLNGKSDCCSTQGVAGAPRCSS